MTITVISSCVLSYELVLFAFTSERSYMGLLLIYFRPTLTWVLHKICICFGLKLTACGVVF